MKKTPGNLKIINIVRDYIVFNLKHFAVLSQNNKELFIKKLKDFIEYYYKNSAVSKYILNHKILKKQLPRLRKYCLLYEKNLEKKYVSQYLRGKKSNFNKYLQDYQEYIKKEGLMAGLKKTSKIIILGSGYLPGTAILLNKIFKTQCCCIDNDKKAVKTSRILIKKMTLENNIVIKHGDATTYPLDGYNAIFITGSSFPKKDIFTHIFNKKTNNTKIIYRRPLGLYKMWYVPSSSEDINKFKIIKKNSYEDSYPFDSVLLVKRHHKI